MSLATNGRVHHRQLLAALAILGWTRGTLAAQSGVSTSSISKVLRGRDTKLSTFDRICQAVSGAGVEFTNQGVELRAGFEALDTAAAAAASAPRSAATNEPPEAGPQSETPAPAAPAANPDHPGFAFAEKRKALGLPLEDIRPFVRMRLTELQEYEMGEYDGWDEDGEFRPEHEREQLDIALEWAQDATLLAEARAWKEGAGKDFRNGYIDMKPRPEWGPALTRYRDERGVSLEALAGAYGLPVSFLEERETTPIRWSEYCRLRNEVDALAAPATKATAANTEQPPAEARPPVATESATVETAPRVATSPDTASAPSRDIPPAPTPGTITPTEFAEKRRALGLTLEDIQPFIRWTVEELSQFEAGEFKPTGNLCAKGPGRGRPCYVCAISPDWPPPTPRHELEMLEIALRWAQDAELLEEAHHWRATKKTCWGETEFHGYIEARRCVEWGATIKQRREELGVSLEELGRYLKIGPGSMESGELPVEMYGYRWREYRHYRDHLEQLAAERAQG